MIRKTLTALCLLLALAGCAQINKAFDVIGKVTQPIANPVTREMLYDIENGAILVTAGLNSYKQACVRRLIAPRCRVVINEIQFYTRQVPPFLLELRAFVKNNDQVNAITAYNAITRLIAGARNVAAANNIVLGGI